MAVNVLLVCFRIILYAKRRPKSKIAPNTLSGHFAKKRLFASVQLSASGGQKSRTGAGHAKLTVDKGLFATTLSDL